MAVALSFAPEAFGQSQVPRPAITWSKIVWSASNIGGKTVEHAAILVEVRFRGIENPVVMQLDTGCEADLVYDVPLSQLGLDSARTGPNRVLLTGSAAGNRFERETFFVRKATGGSWFNSLLQSIQQRISTWRGKQVLLGTLGAAFLEQRILVLDLVANRIAFLGEGEELPPATAARMTFAPIEYRDQKIFVAAAINGVTYRDLALDTGSSAWPVVTTRDRWRKWTGRLENDPANMAVRAWAWDRYINLVGAPISERLCVGAACLDSPLVFFESSGAPNCDFDHYPFRIEGVFGNALFDRGFTLVLDLPHRRLGLFRGSLAQAGTL